MSTVEERKLPETTEEMALPEDVLELLKDHNLSPEDIANIARQGERAAKKEARKLARQERALADEETRPSRLEGEISREGIKNWLHNSDSKSRVYFVGPFGRCYKSTKKEIWRLLLTVAFDTMKGGVDDRGWLILG